jgi:hypothetical protein
MVSLKGNISQINIVLLNMSLKVTSMASLQWIFIKNSVGRFENSFMVVPFKWHLHFLSKGTFLKWIFFGLSFYILKASTLTLSLINDYYGIPFWLLGAVNFRAAYSLEVTGAQLLRPRGFITWDSSF